MVVINTMSEVRRSVSFRCKVVCGVSGSGTARSFGRTDGSSEVRSEVSSDLLSEVAMILYFLRMRRLWIFVPGL